MILTAFRRSLPLTLLILVCLICAGCALSGPAAAPESGPAEEESGLALIVVDRSGLASVSGVGAVRREIRPSVRFAGLYVPASAGRDVVLSLGSGTSTQLAMLAADGTVRKIHEVDGKVQYTVAWSGQGDLAFGYGSTPGRGVGIVSRDGSVANVGCSASSLAFGWVSPNKLVVGDGSTNYVVTAKGCRTLSRVDARKMHEMAFNPVHPTVAYVLRELEYDREARQYVPDSSLYVAGVDGSDALLIAGDRYKPHRPSWSPDGAELAFDARIPDHPERRLISIYDAGRAASAFLNPAAVEGSSSEWDAHWSPGGKSIAYVRQSGDGEMLVTVRPMNGSFSTAVGESGERFARWIDDSHLVVTDGKRERMVSTDGRTSIVGPEGATILRIE